MVLAVKPQNAAEALARLCPVRRPRGVPVDHGRAHHRPASRACSAPQAAIVRAMPNTPAAVRQGDHRRLRRSGRDAAQRALCDALLQAIGTVAWVEDEALLDPVTAVSGSGPAYVFLLAELLEQAAIEQGIPPDLARLLARQTVAGSGALLAASPRTRPPSCAAPSPAPAARPSGRSLC